MAGMGERRLFEVAGHRFEILPPAGADADTVLKAYLPFELRSDADAAPLFTLRSASHEDFGGNYGNPLGRFNDEPPYSWIYDRQDLLVFGFSLSTDKPDFMLCISPDFSCGSMVLPQDCPDALASFAVSNSAMMMYMLATAGLDTLLIHASTVILDGCGYAFTGRSGSGKSTHSRLWLNNLEGSMLLNDDNPVVRIIDGRAFVFGSPWSGKTPCWKNMSAPLKAVVHIFQAPENRIEKLAGIQAYASFITSCSCMKWNRKVCDGVNACVEKLIGLCGFYNLYCLPDREAALLCRGEVSGN